MLENIKLLGLNIRDYFSDLVWLVIVGLISNFSIQLIFFRYLHVWALQQKLDLFPLSYEIIQILMWIIVFLVTRWIWYEYVKTWISSKVFEGYNFDYRKNKLTPRRYLDEWVFQGNSQPADGGLLVTNSNSGCLIKSKRLFRIFQVKRIWKDFTVNIEFDFPLQSKKDINPLGPHTHDINKNIICTFDGCNFPFEDYFGIIFRAQNFDDYFMLELRRVERELIIRPHIRIGGNWDAPILNIDSNSLPINSSRLALNIIIEGNILTISLDNNSVQWLLPANVDTNLIQQAKGKEQITKTLISEVYFRERAGMFGFRCYGNQIALVKKLEILPNA